MRGRPLAVLLAGLLLAGCGDPDLWARWRAERDLWRARRIVQRFQINPRLATPLDYRQAIEAYGAVERRFPLSTWAEPRRVRRRIAREVAALAGDALIASGRLEEARERPGVALEIYRRAARQLEALPTVRLKALLAELALFDRAGDSTRAHDAAVEIARTAPAIDPDLGAPIAAAVEAPLRVASELRTRGAAARADSVLRASEARLVESAAKGRRAAADDAEIWRDIGRLRAARAGGLDEGLAAVRHALAGAPPQAVRAQLVLTLAEMCAAGARPDSALAYTTWGARFGGETKKRAMMMAARVWETVDRDSAIAAYDRYIDAFRRVGPTMPARFRRAELLEEQGRWEAARAEFRSLATSSATDTLALRSLERIVTHHLRAGEREMGRIEAKRALEAMDHLLTTVQDDATLLRIRQLRARLLLDIESWDQACTALEDLWTHYGHLTLGVQAGFQAAELAERELRDPGRARRLYEKLAAGSPKAVDQETARRQLTRLRHERG